MKKPERTILKTDGNGNEFEAPHPDLYNDHGMVVKRRNRMTHLTPKKKKRK